MNIFKLYAYNSINSKRTVKQILKAILIGLLAYYLYSKLYYYHQIKPTTYKNHKIKFLVYGTFYGKKLLPELDSHNCSYNKYFNIIRSNNYEEFDVVFLHFQEYNQFISKYFKYYVNQKKLMIVYIMEPPFSVSKTFDYTKKLNYFDFWTSSYHNFSYFPSLYGQYSISKNISLDTVSLKSQFEERANMALALISNCDSTNNIRLKYIKELEKYFPVEKNGKCYSKKTSSIDLRKKYSQFKFYLSFENSICEHYITEKYWNPLARGMIPIVMSPQFNLPNYIEGSFINSFDYNSPAELAKYLKIVSSNFTEYLKYFKWQEKFQIHHKGIINHPCAILRKIYTSKNYPLQSDPILPKLTNSIYCMGTKEQSELFIYNNTHLK
ncbi:hypothetical protein HZS_7296 [Henneguya salminicola]|nr:hypothetical protein HZS_7296 [Henneguya salminicola]